MHVYHSPDYCSLSLGYASHTISLLRSFSGPSNLPWTLHSTNTLLAIVFRLVFSSLASQAPLEVANKSVAETTSRMESTKLIVVYLQGAQPYTCSTTKLIHDKFVFSIFDAPSAETEDAATSDYGPETYPYAQQCAPVFNRMWGFQTSAQDRLLTSDSSVHTTHAPPSYTDATLAQLA